VFAIQPYLKGAGGLNPPKASDPAWRLTIRGKAGDGTGSTRYAVYAHGRGWHFLQFSPRYFAVHVTNVTPGSDNPLVPGRVCGKENKITIPGPCNESDTWE
jgi:hypothetical protein